MKKVPNKGAVVVEQSRFNRSAITNYSGTAPVRTLYTVDHSHYGLPPYYYYAAIGTVI